MMECSDLVFQEGEWALQRNKRQLSPGMLVKEGEDNSSLMVFGVYGKCSTLANFCLGVEQ